MLASVRAGLAAALVASSLSPLLPPTSPSSAPISPTARSGWKPRSRPKPARSQSPSPRCAARPKQPSPSAISAPACRPWRRSSRSRRAKPATGCGWRARSCRSARTTTASARCSSNAPRPPPISPTSASGNAGEEADALVLLGRTFADRKLWRPALDALPLCARPARGRGGAPDLRAAARRARLPHARLLRSMPMRRRRAPASSSPRSCRASAPISRPSSRSEGNDKPAITTEEKQLCVEGLKHGERYTITLRAGLPSTVHEALAKSADFTIYVRDRKPFVRFTGKAYVLPRTGQRGIPVVSVNTSAVGGRDLPHRRPQPDRHRARRRFRPHRLPAQPRTLRGRPARAIGANRCGRASSRSSRRSMPTSPPRSRSTRRSAISRPASTSWWRSRSRARPRTTIRWRRNGSSSPTSASRPFPAMTASTSSSIRWRRPMPKAGMEVRLISRSNEVLATRTTDAAGHALFEAGLARGEGGMAPAMLVAADPKGDYAFLNLKAPAFDLTDRGVSGRVAPAGLDAFVYAERGVYRSGETVYLTALLRDGQGNAVTGGPLTLVVERPDGVEYRRAVVRRSGPRRPQPDRADRLVRADRDLARARLHRPEAPAGRRDHLHGRGLRPRPARIRSDLADRPHLEVRAGGSDRRRPLPLRRAGGRPRSRRRDRDRSGQGAAGLCRLSVRRRRRGGRDVAAAARRPADDRRNRQGELHGQSRQAAVIHSSARSQGHRAHGGGGRPRGRAQASRCR